MHFLFMEKLSDWMMPQVLEWWLKHKECFINRISKFSDGSANKT